MDATIPYDDRSAICVETICEQYALQPEYHITFYIREIGG